MFYKDKTVYDEALDRIRFLYDNHEMNTMGAILYAGRSTTFAIHAVDTES